MKAVIGEVLPCAAMVLVEGCIIGLTIMAGTAMARGMSPFVFVVYTNALGSIILLPFSFFYHRDNRSEESLFTIPFLLRVFFLGLIGITIAQNLAFVGLSYSSPIVACGMANQIPALTFILGIILRLLGATRPRACRINYDLQSVQATGTIMDDNFNPNPENYVPDPPRMAISTRTRKICPGPAPHGAGLGRNFPGPGRVRGKFF
ncbi:UNVERIFIED_CONTAM: WAT1-related protein [Sesamum angustifolium]|uniref:WAT1-related protein n=1 Tax=Sesamum angustifolium TaxID=2727405 RepID=A0AAW2M6Y2_9LAMI